jgi:hypothetical protein
MVRRGSTVRVRQRASRHPCKQAILVECRFAAGPRVGLLETFRKPDRSAALLATAIVSPVSDVIQALAAGPVFQGFGPRLRAKGIGSRRTRSQGASLLNSRLHRLDDSRAVGLPTSEGRPSFRYRRAHDDPAHGPRGHRLQQPRVREGVRPRQHDPCRPFIRGAHAQCGVG